jgi:hypothetical protein
MESKSYFDNNGLNKGIDGRDWQIYFLAQSAKKDFEENFFSEKNFVWGEKPTALWETVKNASYLVENKSNNKTFQQWNDLLDSIPDFDKKFCAVKNNNLTAADFIRWQAAKAVIEGFKILNDDPDTFGKDLYDDFKEVFFGEYKDKTRTYKNKSGAWELSQSWTDSKDNPCEIRLGTDYIGPSDHLACEAGLSGYEAYNFVKEARSLGGHMVWPRCYGSINIAKGREYYDRIDLTLFALKKWYKGEGVKIQAAFDNAKEWLELFGDFPTFIEFFHLECFVEKNNKYEDVNDKYSVYDLTKYNDEESEEEKGFDDKLDDKDESEPTIPREAAVYRKYVNGCLYCIGERNKELNKELNRGGYYGRNQQTGI